MSLTDEQLALRRTGITATDVPAILGLTPWRSAFDVWAEKMGRGTPAEESEDMQRGTFLEDGARRWYAHRTGAKVAVPGTLAHPEDALVLATPDGIALHAGGDVRGLEIKMPSGAMGWGEPGTDDIPEYYVPQVAWQLAAMCDLTDIVDVFAVLEGKPRLYHVTRDEELEGLLKESMRRWWRDHVVAGRPPEVEARDLPSVSRFYRRHEGEQPLDFGGLSPASQTTLEEYLRAYQDEAAASERRAIWEARAQLVLGSAPGVDRLPEASGFKRIDWRQTKPRTVVDWEAVARYAAQVHGVDEAELMEHAARYTKTKEGSRPFVPRPITKRGAK